MPHFRAKLTLLLRNTSVINPEKLQLFHFKKSKSFGYFLFPCFLVPERAIQFSLEIKYTSDNVKRALIKKRNVMLPCSVNTMYKKTQILKILKKKKKKTEAPNSFLAIYVLLPRASFAHDVTSVVTIPRVCVLYPLYILYITSHQLPLFWPCYRENVPLAAYISQYIFCLSL